MKWQPRCCAFSRTEFLSVGQILSRHAEPIEDESPSTIFVPNYHLSDASVIVNRARQQTDAPSNCSAYVVLSCCNNLKRFQSPQSTEGPNVKCKSCVNALNCKIAYFVLPETVSLRHCAMWELTIRYVGQQFLPFILCGRGAFAKGLGPPLLGLL